MGDCLLYGETLRIPKIAGKSWGKEKKSVSSLNNNYKLCVICLGRFNKLLSF